MMDIYVTDGFSIQPARYERAKCPICLDIKHIISHANPKVKLVYDEGGQVRLPANRPILFYSEKYYSRTGLTWYEPIYTWLIKPESYLYCIPEPLVDLFRLAQKPTGHRLCRFQDIPPVPRARKYDGPWLFITSDNRIHDEYPKEEIKEEACNSCLFNFIEKNADYRQGHLSIIDRTTLIDEHTAYAASVAHLDNCMYAENPVIFNHKVTGEGVVVRYAKPRLSLVSTKEAGAVITSPDHLDETIELAPNCDYIAVHPWPRRDGVD